MQKYGFTVKTVTTDEIKICLFPQIFSIFPNSDYAFLKFYQVRLCIYMQSMHGLVCVCVAWVQLVKRWYLLA